MIITKASERVPRYIGRTTVKKKLEEYPPQPPTRAAEPERKRPAT